MAQEPNDPKSNAVELAEVFAGDNVEDIRSKRKKQPAVPFKNTLTSLLERLDNSALSKLPPLDVRLGVVAVGDGFVLVTIGEDLEVKILSQERAIRHVLSYCRHKLLSREGFEIDHCQAARVIETWRLSGKPIQEHEIKPLRWLDEPGYAWTRLPWESEREGANAAPTWLSLLSRMSNHMAFMSWVGSLFFDESLNHQYCWIYGLGNDGKGAMNRFFARIFTETYRTKQPPGVARGVVDKFWAYDLIGSRLVVMPECENPTFVTSALFKMMTGGDRIPVEAKGAMPFNVSLNCKFMIFSNNRPVISSDRADTRRIIFCEFDKNRVVTRDPDFESKLWAEGGDFLRACISEYIAVCPDHGPVPTDTENVDGIVAVAELDFDEVFDSYFRVTFAEEDTGNWAKPVEVQRLLKHAFRGNPVRQREFLHWLERKHGVVRRRARAGGDRDYRYIGLIVRPALPTPYGDVRYVD